MVQLLEVVARRWSVKKGFLEISQTSQENNCAKLSFLIKLQASSRTFISKRRSKPWITHVIHSRNAGKFAQMRPPNFWDTKIKKDLYKALYKISIISIKYDIIKSYYAKSAMWEKERWNRMLFYKTQELSKRFNFNKVRP